MLAFPPASGRELKVVIMTHGPQADCIDPVPVVW
jgi:hypothetical protein